MGVLFLIGIAINVLRVIIENWKIIAVALIALAVLVGLGFGLARAIKALPGWLRARAIRKFVEDVNRFSANDNPTLQQWSDLSKKRKAVEPMPQDVRDDLARVYRHFVALVVDDGRVTADEQKFLILAATSLGLPEDLVESARREGFLEVYRAALSNGQLSTQEEESLFQIQKALGVDPASVRAASLHISDLAEAGRVADSPLAVIHTVHPLMPDEDALLSTDAVQLVAQREGGRIRFTSEKAGEMLVTNKRLVFIAGGETSISLGAIRGADVNDEKSLLTVVEDGRSLLHFFRVPKPLVVRAYIVRAST